MSTATVPAPSAADAPQSEPTSVPGWLLLQARDRPKAVAVRVKDLGRWLESTWSETAERVAGVGRALMHMGVAAGDRVGIVSGNRAEWIVTDLAVQGIGAITVSVSAMSTPEALASQLGDAGAKVVVVEDEEQFDKVMEVRARLGLTQVIVIDPRGIRRLEAPASSFEALEALGSADAVRARSGSIGAWATSVAGLDPATVATITYTCGATGEPKGVALTHQALTTAAAAGSEALGLRAGDEIVSNLPLSDIAERTLTVGQAVRVGAVVNFGEGGLSLLNDLREVRPTVMLGSPRVWERLRDSVEAGARGAGFVKRRAMRRARKRGRGPAALLTQRPLRSSLGLARTRIAITSTAPCAEDLVEYWRVLGVPLRQAYSVTESAGFAAIAAPDDPARSVGRPIAGVDVDIATGGEIVLSGPDRFAGGKFHTGDVGSWDDGVLTITGRSKDLVITSTGHKVAPRAIEAALEASPYVRTAVVVGDGRRCTGALVVVDATTVGDWAAERGESFTTFARLASLPQVRELIGTVVDDVNVGLDEPSRIGCFALVPQEIGDDDELVTETSKLRRGAIAERFDDLIEQMYAERGGAGT